jgi:hypothetical protein
MMLATVLPCGASAQQAAATSPKVHELATALAQEWLTEQGVAKSAPAPPAQEADGSVDDVSSRIGAIHDQIMALARAIPNLPNEFRRAVARVTAIDPDAGRGQVFLDLGIFGDPYMVATRRLAAEAHTFLHLAVFGMFGFAAQWLFRRMTDRSRRHLDGLPMETVKDRLRVIAARFALAFGPIAAFVAGSIVPLLALDWDPIRRDIVLGFLTVSVVLWAAVAIGDWLLSPDDQRFRIIPMDALAARSGAAD